MTATRDFPQVNVDILTDREALVIQLHYADGWSLRRVARGIGVHHRSVQRSHDRALQALRTRDCYCVGFGDSSQTRHIETEASIEQTQDEGSSEEA